MKTQSQNLDCLIDPHFQGWNRLFWFYYLQIMVRTGHDSKGGKKRLQCYDRWKKPFWSAGKKWSKNMITLEKLQLVKELILQLFIC